MRVVSAFFACVLCVMGCAGAEPEAPHKDPVKHSKPIHARKDAAPEVREDAAADEPESDAAVDGGIDEIDAAMSHVVDPTEPPRKDPEDAGAKDASVDAATDAGHDANVPNDASTDAATDASSDASTDAATDASSDASTDAATDASTDAATDASDDAATDAGDDAGDDAGPDASTPVCSGPPGLWSDDHCSVLATGVRPYLPQFPLWSDGASKERFIYLPPGTTIDTRNPDRWAFPVGTRLYKHFSMNGVRVETRVLTKTTAATGYTSWTAVSYAWSADQLSVSAAPTAGVKNALGSGLDIPSSNDCRTCHNMASADAPIGFNAIQLNHANAGVTLASLISGGLLVNGSGGGANITTSNSVIPGDAVTKAALGYLHANCGHCHGGPSPAHGMRLWSVVGMTDISDAPILSNAVCRCLDNWTCRTNSSDERYELRVAPSRSDLSGIIGRMSRRGVGEQMPRIGTNVIDPTGIATVKAWIDSLDDTCNVSAPACTDSLECK